MMRVKTLTNVFLLLCFFTIQIFSQEDEEACPTIASEAITLVDEVCQDERSGNV